MQLYQSVLKKYKSKIMLEDVIRYLDKRILKEKTSKVRGEHDIRIRIELLKELKEYFSGNYI